MNRRSNSSLKQSDSKFSVGIDIEHPSRFNGKTLKWLKKVFTNHELDYCLQRMELRNQRLAGHWAAKEAVFKTLEEARLGVPQTYLKSIEIKHDPAGKPYATVWMDRKNASTTEVLSNFHITISHTRDIAIAVAIRISL